MKKFLSLVIAIALLSTSCASIVCGTKKKFTINSTPEKAKVSITDKVGNYVYQGETPATIKLKRGAGFFEGQRYTLKFEMEGYESQTLTIESKVNGMYCLGNIIFGGLIGWLIVDPLTGAMWTMNPKDISVIMDKTDKTNTDEKQVTILLLSQVPMELRDKMIELN